MPCQTAEKKIAKPRKKFDLQPSAKEIGQGIRRALIVAGYKTDKGADLKRAAEVLTMALPAGQGFSGNELCHLCRGKKAPQAGRLAAVVAILGLNLEIIFPILYDSQGNQITRITHPKLFNHGPRRNAGRT